MVPPPPLLPHFAIFGGSGFLIFGRYLLPVPVRLPCDPSKSSAPSPFPAAFWDTSHPRRLRDLSQSAV